MALVPREIVGNLFISAIPISLDFFLKKYEKEVNKLFADPKTASSATISTASGSAAPQSVYVEYRPSIVDEFVHLVPVCED